MKAKMVVLVWAALSAIVLIPSGRVSAAVVDGHVYADYYSHLGTVVLGGDATSLQDAVAAQDGKYVKISGAGFSLILQFPTPAIAPYIRVHFVNGTTSEYFRIQEYGATLSDYKYGCNLVNWIVPPDPVSADVGMSTWGDKISYVGLLQAQGYDPGTVYIDAVEALNVLPVVSAGPDLTISPDQQPTTVIQGTISDSYQYSGGYLWQKDGVSLTGWNPLPLDASAPLNLSTLAPLAPGSYTFRLVTQDGGANSIDEMILTVISNTAPVADAGADLSIYTVEEAGTVIHGSVSDADGDALTYRWLEGTIELQASTPAEPNGAAILRLSSLSPAPAIDSHTLTLEVTDAKGSISTDAMVLAVLNTKPQAEPSPTSLVVEAGGSFVLRGKVWDFDGDVLNYQWVMGVLPQTELLASGTVDAPDDGTPIAIADLTLSADQRFVLGDNTVILIVDDPENEPVSEPVTVTVKDTTAPTIAPNSSTSMLWPPNHMLRSVSIQANAVDKGGGDLVLDVVVQSNEPANDGGDGSTDVDWYIDSVDNATGMIALQLRAERSGGGTGRVYTVTITATDEGGNQSSSAVQIRVPHDSKKK
jgi:hypothetical protein